MRRPAKLCMECQNFPPIDRQSGRLGFASLWGLTADSTKGKIEVPLARGNVGPTHRHSERALCGVSPLTIRRDKCTDG